MCFSNDSLPRRIVHTREIFMLSSNRDNNIRATEKSRDVECSSTSVATTNNQRICVIVLNKETDSHNNKNIPEEVNKNRKKELE